MALSTYTELKAAVADLANRTDLTSQIVDAIALAEAEMQIDCKLVEFEADSSITITSGSGPLPTGFLSLRAAYWDASTKQPLTYMAPDRFNELRNSTGGVPSYYTLSGSTIRVDEGASGTVVAICNLRFSPLSGSVASNAILASFPNAYLYGALKHVCIVTEDDAKLQKFGTLFNAEKQRIDSYIGARRWAGPLQIRAR
jgi:hypothetical protein